MILKHNVGMTTDCGPVALQETKLLQSIDRLRGEADVVKREQRVAEALALMAHPKAWPLSNGALLEVHTPATTKYVSSTYCLPYTICTPPLST